MKNNPNNQFATKSDLKELGSELKDDFKELRNELKEDLNGLKEDFKNHTGFLIEQFSDQVKVVAEQYSGIEKRLTRVESKTDMLVETVADIKVDTAMIREGLESKADKSEHKKLEHRVTVLESRA